MDNNGYNESILPGHDEHQCYVCKSNGGMERCFRHEIFNGAYRDKSKRMGCWVNLCYMCHTMAHGDKKTMSKLKRDAQLYAMETFGWDNKTFVGEFGKNYV